jgi:hypothetical protein
VITIIIITNDTIAILNVLFTRFWGNVFASIVSVFALVHL